MRMLCVPLLSLFLSAPALAQEEPPPEDPAATEAAPAEAAPAEAAPTEEIPVDESSGTEAPADASADTAATDTPAEEAPAEEPVAEGEPWHLYAGADYTVTTFQASGIGGFAHGNYDSGMYRLRFGTRILEMVGLEFQYGLDAGGDGVGEVKTDDHMAVFAVPTATVLEVVEVGVPVGYVMSSVSGAGASADLDGLAYGFVAELPLRTFGDSLPDLRLTAGWTIYHRENDSQLYGGNLGLRYDFGTDGGFCGVVDFVCGLWPFGDDEGEAAAAEPAS